MAATLTQTLRSRWLALAIHVGLWWLLYLALTHLGGKAPEFREARATAQATPCPVPVAKLHTLFAPAQWPKPLAETNALNPFLTSYFVPPPAPAPPPPTTRKIEMTYQGFYLTANNVTHTIIKVADAYVVTRLGAPVASNLFVAQATMQSLILTNPAAQTNLLLLNAKKEIEVPLK
ncbi:MAG TPA: hypothetical protein VNZ22_10455 [Bacillota bacterium]|nr:hypothetical protein [Bacillota bacterium]